MKRLTVEELADWKRCLGDCEGLDASSLEGLVEIAPALLAMASRLVEVESALAHIQASGHCGADIMSPERIIAWATELGWTSPTQNPNDGGRDGKA